MKLCPTRVHKNVSELNRLVPSSQNGAQKISKILVPAFRQRLLPLRLRRGGRQAEDHPQVQRHVNVLRRRAENWRQPQAGSLSLNSSSSLRTRWQNKLGCLSLATTFKLLLIFSSKVVSLSLGACIIKLITAVIYGFCNKLECLSLVSISSLV
jgi:hypothetical protein